MRKSKNLQPQQNLSIEKANDKGVVIKNLLPLLMSEGNINAQELSYHTGVSIHTINKLKQNQMPNPTISTLMPIAKFFGLNLSQFLGEEDLPSGYIVGEFNEIERRNTILPLLRFEELENWICKRPLINTDSFTVNIKVSKNAFALKVQGQSMLPSFDDKSIIIVEPEVEAEDCDFVIVKIKHQSNPIFRQYLKDGDLHIFRPLNDKYGQATPAEYGEFKIYGVVIQNLVNYKKVL
ncbi:MAG: helix-turn-helix domain-containing protein [Legionellales bacterium]|nr:helix-turn-helix domain-containing protein [Legionellales bacterium]